MRKLTPNQKKILEALADGFTCQIGKNDGTAPGNVILSKKNEDNIVTSRTAICSLEKRGLIQRIRLNNKGHTKIKLC